MFNYNEIENPPASVTLSTYGNDSTFKFKGSDLSGYELIEAFAGLMVAHSFHFETVVECMREYVDEHTPEVFTKNKDNRRWVYTTATNNKVND